MGFFIFSFNPLDTMKHQRMQIDQVMAAYKRVRLNGAKPNLPDGLLRKEIYTTKKVRLSLQIGGISATNMRI